MKKLTVIIPCYNEFKTINTIINKILEINFIETQIMSSMISQQMEVIK